MSAAPRHWLALAVLTGLWGSAYFLVELALMAWSPAEIAGLRVIFAALALLVALAFTARLLPRGGRAWAYLAVIALVGNCAPFFLISWGQQQVESGLAGILAATTPVGVLLMAHFMLDDEPLTRRQAAAGLLCFGGVVVLMGPESLAALGGSAERLVAQLAVLVGALCYALATVLARRMPDAHPLATSAGVMLVASLAMGPLTLDAWSMPDTGWVPAAAIVVLGVLATGFASILYFYLIRQTGARFTSMLNYMVPVWAVALGTLVLKEQLALNYLVALALILAGVVLAGGGMLPPPAGGTRTGT